MGGRGARSQLGGGGGGGGVGGPPLTGKDAERFNRRGEKIPDKLRRALEQRFASGREAARELYDMLVANGGAVKDPHVLDGAYYDPNDNGVYMDFLEDMYNPQEPGTTWFHEHGHFIDFNMPMRVGPHGGWDRIHSSWDPQFLDALKADVQNYEMHYGMANPDVFRLYGDAAKGVAEYLKSLGHETSSIQDIFGGVHRDRSNYTWGHDNDYWTDDIQVGVEAYAEMFEAQFSKKRAQYMEEFLPTAWKRFNEMLDEDVARLKRLGFRAR